jgi:hypothetical protein
MDYNYLIHRPRGEWMPTYGHEDVHIVNALADRASLQQVPWDVLQTPMAKLELPIGGEHSDVYARSVHTPRAVRV